MSSPMQLLVELVQRLQRSSPHSSLTVTAVQNNSRTELDSWSGKHLGRASADFQDRAPLVLSKS